MDVSTLMLSPFYPSLMFDNGYDITSFTEIDPIYGTLEDFLHLIEELRERDMNIIIDFVANHTSFHHQWFEKSVEKEEPYTNYYVWVDPQVDSTDEEPIPPNNWLSIFGGSAWTYNERRKQFYLHQFLPEQPDLNYRNPNVKSEMESVLKFWLDKGVDGFRIDACSHLFESTQLLDEPPSKKPGVKKEEYEYLDHIYTKGQNENLSLLQKWRSILDIYENETQKTKLMIVEVSEKLLETMKYYGSVHRQLANFPFNFELFKISRDSTGLDVKETIDAWISNMPKGKIPNWVLSSHDYPRVVSRVGPTLAQSLQMLVMLLPGFFVCYYGDEIGMDNAAIPPEEMRDSFALRTKPSNSRDPMRTPMQWDAGKNAGFSDCDTTWLPVNPNHGNVNVEAQQGDPSSFLETFKKLVSFRKYPSINFGVFDYPLVGEKTFSLVAHTVGSKSFLFILNMSPEENIIDLLNVHPLLSDSSPTLELTNCNHYKTLTPEVYAKESDAPSTSVEATLDSTVKVNLSNVYLGPFESLILSFIGES